jgi:hypothetical protein
MSFPASPGCSNWVQRCQHCTALHCTALHGIATVPACPASQHLTPAEAAEELEVPEGVDVAEEAVREAVPVETLEHGVVPPAYVHRTLQEERD